MSFLDLGTYGGNVNWFQRWLDLCIKSQCWSLSYFPKVTAQIRAEFGVESILFHILCFNQHISLSQCWYHSNFINQLVKKKLWRNVQVNRDRVWFVCLSSLNQKCLFICLFVCVYIYIRQKNFSWKITVSLIFNVTERWPLLVKKNLPTELVAFWNTTAETVSPSFMPCGIFLFKSSKKYVGNWAK